jgi:hypothetical protein
MAMSKQDFIALADAIRAHNEASATHRYAPEFSSDHIATLAAFCRSQNPNFMKDRWLDYITGKCGPGGGAIKAKKESAAA